MIITFQDFDKIKKASNGKQFSLKVDFGLKEVLVVKEGRIATIDSSFSLDLSEKIKDNFCYALDEQGLRKIAYFSEKTNRYYKLTPTDDWPTLSIGSVPMHRLRSARYDAQAKIDLIKPYGEVLDTCMGLGYTSILAARTASWVRTFEIDETVFLVAKENPCSKDLFLQANIEIKLEDISLAIQNIKTESIDCIIHDPPTFKLSPVLFNDRFYQQLFRVLKKSGRMIHYTPLYKIKSGFDFPSKVKQRLKRIKFDVSAFYPIPSAFICRK
ncbi:MAG: MnmC family methyltransferase [Candidatus Omnitrophica bacterium]|nr:MnmC family methyltransferase [Candidatus Omnitrophota bacterium]